MLKIKLFAAFAFLSFAAGVFLLADNKSSAQTNKTSEKRDEVLEKVAGYKVWKQVQKPANDLENLTKKDVLIISDSSVAG
jgi:hypothetical protein